jgi:hypothetical protein
MLGNQEKGPITSKQLLMKECKIRYNLTFEVNQSYNLIYGNGRLIKKVGWLLMDLLMEAAYKPSVEVHINFLIFLYVS